MVGLVVAAVVLVIIMLIFVFILFRNIMKRIDENAKKYFVNKMQDYDYIVEKKQKRLDELNSEIETIKAENRNILAKVDDEQPVAQNNIVNHVSNDEMVNQSINVDINVPEYRDIQFFDNYKEVKKVFTVDNEKIIRKFIEDHKNTNEEKEYKALKKLSKKFDSDSLYSCLTLSPEEQIKVLDEVLTDKEKKLVHYDSMIKKEKFTIKDFVNIVKDRMQQIEPTIYIYVNGVNDNYDFIDNNIITKQYVNMSEGIIIKYRNKVYDYSI